MHFVEFTFWDFLGYSLSEYKLLAVPEVPKSFSKKCLYVCYYYVSDMAHFKHRRYFSVSQIVFDKIY